MYVERLLSKSLQKAAKPGKVVVLYGARRVGKTTLLKKYAQSFETGALLMVSGEDSVTKSYLEHRSVENLRAYLGECRIFIVDEAQYVQQIGLTLKLIVDHLPHITVIASGSSSFDLARDVGEPLVGRKYTLLLYPIAQAELSALENSHVTLSRLPGRLIYGSYPEILSLPGNRDKERYLRELTQGYLFKDILSLEGIRHPRVLEDLLRLLAFQIGKDVSLNELAGQLNIHTKTVARYLDLLEKTFIIFRRGAFSGNLRKMVRKNNRYYFFDNGIRNAVINSFAPLNLRNDTGMLWENYLMNERLKRNAYRDYHPNTYFWRTYTQVEVDLVEEYNGQLNGFEIKWKARRKKAPASWLETYPNAQFETIDQSNYLDFIL